MLLVWSCRDDHAADATALYYTLRYFSHLFHVTLAPKLFLPLLAQYTRSTPLRRSWHAAFKNTKALISTHTKIRRGLTAPAIFWPRRGQVAGHGGCSLSTHMQGGCVHRYLLTAEALEEEYEGNHAIGKYSRFWCGFLPARQLVLSIDVPVSQRRAVRDETVARKNRTPRGFCCSVPTILCDVEGAAKLKGVAPRRTNG